MVKSMAVAYLASDLKLNPGYTYDDDTGCVRYEWDVYILKVAEE